MSEETMTLEYEASVWHDAQGYKVGIRNDRDGLQLAEFYYDEGDGKKDVRSFTCPWPMAVLLAKATLELAGKNGVDSEIGFSK